MCQCQCTIHWHHLRLLGSCAKQLSVNLYLLVSTSIKLAVFSKCQKVAFSSDSSINMFCFGCLWLRSRIRAHNKLSEAKQLLGLFQYIVLLSLYQSSSSCLHYKLKLTKAPLDLCLDKTRLLVIYHARQPNLCSLRLWNGKRRSEKLRHPVTFSILRGVL